MRWFNHLSISSFWFATNVLWTSLLLIMLPHQAAHIDREHKAEIVGLMVGVGAVCALVIPLIVGPLSDRCASKWGRRRPFIATGVAINLAGLVLMYFGGFERSFPLYFIGYLVVQIGNNIATGAYNGVIPDVVPERHRGTASGYMGLMTQFGSAVGAVSSGLLMGAGYVRSSYVLISVTLFVFALLTLVGVQEKPLTRKPPPFSWGAYFKSLWIDPREYPDFAWVWITRALVMLGFYIVQPFLLYYLADVIHVDNPEKNAQLLFLLVLVAATVTGILGGWLSDRIGRKRIVYVANGLMAATAMLFVFCHSMSEVLIVGLLFGLGYGAYISVDWALGTDVLPSREDAGKDMAVWHIAMVFPQSLGAPAGALLLHLFGFTTTLEKGEKVPHYAYGGYVCLFGLAAVSLALGAFLLRNVRKAS